MEIKVNHNAGANIHIIFEECRSIFEVTELLYTALKLDGWCDKEIKLIFSVKNLDEIIEKYNTNG